MKMKKTYFLILLLLLISHQAFTQVPFTLSTEQRAAVEGGLTQIQTLVAAEGIPNTNSILLGLNAAPPASLQALVQREGQDTYFTAMLKLRQAQGSTLFAEVRNGGSVFFASLEERIWVASQYAHLVALVTNTTEKGGNLVQVWSSRTNPAISKAEYFRFRILAEIKYHIENGSALSEATERATWLGSAGSTDAYARFCTLLVGKNAIAREAVYRDLLRTYRLEQDNNIVSYLIDSLVACEDLVFVKSVAADMLANNSGLDASNQARLQEIVAR
jgi:hypothetical protein